MIGDCVTSIGERAFYECDSLTSIVIPSGVTSIGSWAFAHCSGLTSITIPDSVTSIGDWAFYDCGGSSLTSVTIGGGVTSIGEGTFFKINTENLQYVRFKSLVPPSLGGYIFDFDIVGVPLYVPAESLNDYLNNADWSPYAAGISAWQD